MKVWPWFLLLGLALAYLGFQAVVKGHEVGDWCGTHSVAVAETSRSDWTWVPPGWDCVYSQYERGGSRDIARKRAFSE